MSNTDITSKIQSSLKIAVDSQFNKHAVGGQNNTQSTVEDKEHNLQLTTPLDSQDLTAHAESEIKHLKNDQQFKAQQSAEDAVPKAEQLKKLLDQNQKNLFQTIQSLNNMSNAPPNLSNQGASTPNTASNGQTYTNTVGNFSGTNFNSQQQNNSNVMAQASQSGANLSNKQRNINKNATTKKQNKLHDLLEDSANDKQDAIEHKQETQNQNRSDNAILNAINSRADVLQQPLNSITERDLAQHIENNKVFAQNKDQKAAENSKASVELQSDVQNQLGLK